MSRQYKPLKMRDVVFTGSAVDGIVVERIVDGEKVASKQFSISEVIELRDWLAAFIRQHRYSNYRPANIDEVEKLSITDIDTIRERFNNGEPLQKLADEYKVPLQQIIGISRT